MNKKTYTFNNKPAIITYTLKMPDIVYVQLKDVAQPCKVQGKTVEQDGNVGQLSALLVVKDEGGVVVGSFNLNLVAGWWTQFE